MLSVLPFAPALSAPGLSRTRLTLSAPRMSRTRLVITTAYRPTASALPR